MGDPLLAFLAANDVLACARNAIADGPGGVPDRMRVCQVPGGLVAWDDCCNGQLTVNIDRLYPSNAAAFPAQDAEQPQPCGGQQTAMDLSVLILRCYPAAGPNRSAPSCDALEAAARVQAEDRLRIWQALRCCLSGWSEVIDGALRQQLAVGPQGGCAGSLTTLTIGLRDFCPCDPAAEAQPLGLVTLKTGAAT